MWTGFFVLLLLFTIVPVLGTEFTLLKIHLRNECMNELINLFQKRLAVHSLSYVNITIKSDFTFSSEFQ